MSIKMIMKKVLKGFLTIFLVIILVALAGVWRLISAPLNVSSKSFLMHYIPHNIKFSEAHLKAGAFYIIPEIEIKDAVFSSENFHIKAHYATATWHPFGMFKGSLSMNSLVLDQAKIALLSEAQESSQSQIEAFLKMLPIRSIHIKRSGLTLKNKGKIYHIRNLNASASRHFKDCYIHVSGLLKEKNTHSFFFNVEGTLSEALKTFSGTIDCKNIRLSDLPIIGILKKYTSFYKDPLNFRCSLRYHEATHDFDLKASVQNPNFLKTLLHLEARREKEGDIKLIIMSPHMDLPALSRLWPPAEGDRFLFFRSFSKGSVQNARLEMILSSYKSQVPCFSMIKGSCNFQDVSLKYSSPLDPIEEAEGKLFFDRGKMSILIKRAKIKGLNISTSQFFIAELNTETPLLKGRIAFDGPLENGAKHLQKFTQDNVYLKEFKATSGLIKGHLLCSVPLSKNSFSSSDIPEIKATITQGDFSFPHETQKLCFSKTHLRIEKKKGTLFCSGKGYVNGLLGTFSYGIEKSKTSHLKKTTLIGSGSLRDVRKFMPQALQSHVISPGGGPLYFSFKSKETSAGSNQVNLEVNAQKAHLFLPILGWHKPKEEPCHMNVRWNYGAQPQNKSNAISLVSKDFVLKGSASLNQSGKTSQFKLHSLTINGAKGTAQGFLREGLWTISLSTPVVHMKPILMTLKDILSNLKQKEPVDLDLEWNIPVLLFKPEQYKYKNVVLSVKIRKNLIRFLKIKGSNNTDPILIRYEPYQGKMVLEVDAPQLDPILHLLNVSENVQAKGLQIVASKPLNDPESPFEGTLVLEHIKLSKVPVLTKMLSLMSLDGLVQGLAHQGIAFNDNYAKFEYKSGRIALHNAHIMSSSLGITATGYVDLNNKTLDLEGGLIPANFLNQLLGKIPMLGKILSGGKDQGIFSISYVAKGSLKNPNIQTMPLSIVAPNMIKSFFKDLAKENKNAPTLSNL